MNFQESLAYLYGLGNEVSAMKLGLENVRKLLSALENPEKKFLKIQVAGTNGKGSTCAFLDAICRSAGINTGLYTSPHLINVTERIRINGEEISEKDFARHATRVREIGERFVENSKSNESRIPNPESRIFLETVPTFFEQMTAIALSAFAEAKIELAILETGLGGRLDATTAVNAEIVAITPIDFDHQKILGNSLTEIALEKAAIIRANTKVVSAKQKPEAEKVIAEVCKNFDVEPRVSNFKSQISGADEQGKFVVGFQTEKAEYKNVRLNLAGRHQIENAKVTVLLAEILQDFFTIKSENVTEGLQTATHKGRLEFYENILFDGAHNVAGARALREFLDEFVNQPVTMIFGAMRDKDLTEIAATLFPKADKIIFTAPDNPRSLEAKDLTEFLPRNFNRKKVYQTKTVAEAVETARRISGENDLICVTGSIYLIGEAQKNLSGGAH